MLRDYVPMPLELRRSVLARDNYTCQECGYIGGKKFYDIHVHHKIPYRVGGEHVESNLVTLCSFHHNQRDKEHKLRLRGMNLPKPKPIPPEPTLESTIRIVIERNVYDALLSKRALGKIIKALRPYGYRAEMTTMNRVTSRSLAIALEPQNIDFRQKLMCFICETAGLQPKRTIL